MATKMAVACLVFAPDLISFKFHMHYFYQSLNQVRIWAFNWLLITKMVKKWPLLSVSTCDNAYNIF